MIEYNTREYVNGKDDEQATSTSLNTTNDNSNIGNSNNLNSMQTNNTNNSLNSNSNSENKDISYILDSEFNFIKEEDLKDMDLSTLNYAYNEIFARHGHDFKTKSLDDYFSSKSWYNKIEGKSVSVNELSDVEKRNLYFIKERIDVIKSEKN